MELIVSGAGRGRNRPRVRCEKHSGKGSMRAVRTPRGATVQIWGRQGKLPAGSGDLKDALGLARHSPGMGGGG